tara:strand:+ start:14540 stop:14731 length:192 start_codon:yes stop_codon:yes gene_type:complete
MMSPEIFRKLRVKMGVSQHELAILMGFKDRSSVSNFETGRRMISPRIEFMINAISEGKETKHD